MALIIRQQQVDQIITWMPTCRKAAPMTITDTLNIEDQDGT